MNRSIQALIAAVCTPLAATATIIDGTTFDTEPVGGLHTDAATDGTVLAANADVDTTNASGGTVDSVTGSELGFDMFWRNTLGGQGWSNGDPVGVTDDTSDVGAYTSGDRGYIIQDPDGRARLNFDEVDLTGFTDKTVRVDVFLNATDWELADALWIYVTTDQDTYYLLDTRGADIDDSFAELEGGWTTLSIDLPDTVTSASLRVRFESDSNDERVYIDTVKFEGVPEPASLTLMAAGMLLIGSRRRG